MKRLLIRKKSKKLDIKPKASRSFCVSKLLSYQRVEVQLTCFAQILRLYWTKKLISIPFHSEEIKNLIDCKLNLKNPPNFFNMVTFCILDFLFTCFLVIYIKLRKLNSFKFIVDDHSLLLKILIVCGIFVTLDYYQSLIFI